jgi:hypothetical protein
MNSDELRKIRADLEAAMAERELRDEPETAAQLLQRFGMFLYDGWPEFADRISALIEEVESQKAVIKTAIESYVVRVVKRPALAMWWTLEIPALGNRTAQQALDEGDGMAVLEVAVSYCNPSYS